MSDIEKLIKNVEEIEQKIFDLNQTIADDMNNLQLAKSEAQEALDLAAASEASKTLKDKQYGCGTANIEAGPYKVKVTVSRKVKWDEAKLRDVRKKIVEAGQDPSAYIKEKLSVTETAYKGFSDAIKKEFEPARSVEPNTPKITIEKV